MAAQAELGSTDSAALWASRTSSWWVGWIVPVGMSILSCLICRHIVYCQAVGTGTFLCVSVSRKLLQFGSRYIALVQDTTDVVHVPQLRAARQPLTID